jgi:magnesium transporter
MSTELDRIDVEQSPEIDSPPPGNREIEVGQMLSDFTPRSEEVFEDDNEDGMILSPLSFDNNYEMFSQHYQKRGEKLRAVQAELAELKKRVATNKSAPGGGHGAGPAYGLDAYFELSVMKIYKQRIVWLVGLLLLQSVSGMILEGFNSMLEKHLCIAIFLPMIIGSGGNAGNQPGVMVTQALGSGRIEMSTMKKLLVRETTLAFMAGATIGLVGFARVYMDPQCNNFWSAFAIGFSLGLVVLAACFLGIFFSWGLDQVGINPADGAAPLLTTVSDLVGISILCLICWMVWGN